MDAQATVVAEDVQVAAKPGGGCRRRSTSGAFLMVTLQAIRAILVDEAGE